MAVRMYGWLLLAAVAAIATDVLLIGAQAEFGWPSSAFGWPSSAVALAVLAIGLVRVSRTWDGSSGSGDPDGEGRAPN